MVSPIAVNFQISTGQSLFLESRLPQQSPGRRILGQAGGFQPVEGQGSESEVGERTHSRQGMTLSREAGAAPVSHRAHLGDPAPDIGQGDAPGQGAVALAEDKERIGRAKVDIPGVGGEATPPSGPRQVIVRPGRLPGLQEGP